MSTTINVASNDLHLRPLPYLDAKWLRADLLANLRSVEDAAVLWNTLIQDCELVSSADAPVRNEAGQLSYLGDDGKHYCGIQKLQCACCPPNEYCGPLSACNCVACHSLDSDAAIKKMTSAAQIAASSRTTSEILIETWLWGQTPSRTDKVNCQRILLSELHNIALQAAGNCLSALHLRQQFSIYERYFVALARYKQQQQEQTAAVNSISVNCHSVEMCKLNEERSSCSLGTGARNHRNETFGASKLRYQSTMMSAENPLSPGTVVVPMSRDQQQQATLSLARVGTRAALNFSFAFLRRAWRSGEDTEMCSELLCEALESLQDLPEASLFDCAQVSRNFF